jgi:hypothetical protein
VGGVLGGILVALVAVAFVLFRRKPRQQQETHPAPETGQGTVGEKNVPIENVRQHDRPGEMPSGALGDERAPPIPIRYPVEGD